MAGKKGRRRPPHTSPGPSQAPWLRWPHRLWGRPSSQGAHPGHRGPGGSTWGLASLEGQAVLSRKSPRCFCPGHVPGSCLPVAVVEGAVALTQESTGRLLSPEAKREAPSWLQATRHRQSYCGFSCIRAAFPTPASDASRCKRWSSRAPSGSQPSSRCLQFQLRGLRRDPQGLLQAPGASLCLWVPPLLPPCPGGQRVHLRSAQGPGAHRARPLLRLPRPPAQAPPHASPSGPLPSGRRRSSSEAGGEIVPLGRRNEIPGTA